MIPRSRQIRVTPAQDKSTPETEQIEVTDLALMFVGGHLLPLTLFPDDEIVNGPDQPLISIASSELTIIHRDRLLYETFRKRTMTRVKKATTPIST